MAIINQKDHSSPGQILLKNIVIYQVRRQQSDILSGTLVDDEFLAYDMPSSYCKDGFITQQIPIAMHSSKFQKQYQQHDYTRKIGNSCIQIWYSMIILSEILVDSEFLKHDMPSSHYKDGFIQGRI